ncbi:conserved hypothetical protein [Ricinus communis]|uniref:Uncharacterized protein n=1 Tax=Ricinus communis TaxID=3988 RepID=B9S7H1_RICCO|nr:conserved hypothetical protein [Ricinus communis]
MQDLNCPICHTAAETIDHDPMPPPSSAVFNVSCYVPSMGWIKLNIDGAVFANASLSGLDNSVGQLTCWPILWRDMRLKLQMFVGCSY